ncbi:uncharacterized protein LOC143913963 isoform X1 [Arctopsyche grandis]|uniref:uncharacterized protein LOC143913963 isoform X1 n=1 Tax=Arctopsyche grandis TaxID=121162 RepID=UPI00406D82A0
MDTTRRKCRHTPLHGIIINHHHHHQQHRHRHTVGLSGAWVGSHNAPSRDNEHRNACELQWKVSSHAENSHGTRKIPNSTKRQNKTNKKSHTPIFTFTPKVCDSRK